MPSCVPFVCDALRDLSASKATEVVKKKIIGRTVPLTALHPDKKRKRKRPEKKTGRTGEERVPVDSAAAAAQAAAWERYATSALAGASSTEQVAEIAASLDRHGARVFVGARRPPCRSSRTRQLTPCPPILAARSSCPSHVGIYGTLVLDTGRTLVIQGEKRRWRVPKRGTTVRLALPRAVASAVGAATIALDAGGLK